MDEKESVKYIYFIYGLEENRNLTIKSNFNISTKMVRERKNEKDISFKIILNEISIDQIKLKNNK